MAAATRIETIIVGAGPAGLAVGACLRRAGREFAIFERAGVVGSAWRRHYERLHLHTVKQHSGLPYRAFSRALPRYVPRDAVADYLEDYARAFELAPRLGEAVLRAEPTASGFRVETAAGIYEARHLIVGSGYNAAPFRPSFAGASGCKVPVLHSSQYQTAAAYRGQRVLVVGAGNTGAELALDLCEQGAAAIELCVRGPIHVVPRDLWGMPSQIASIQSGWIPVPVRDVLFQGLVALTIGDLSRYGIERPREGIVAQIERLGRIPLLDVGTVEMIQRGRIRVRPEIRQLTESGADFVDGTGAAYDAIILATGFRPGLESFLFGCNAALDARGNPKRHGRESAVAGLYFVGFHNVVTGLLREIGREALDVAADIARARHPAAA